MFIVSFSTVFTNVCVNWMFGRLQRRIFIRASAITSVSTVSCYVAKSEF